MDDVRLPVDVERGAQGGPGFKTSIVTLASGAESRNQEWSISRGRWNVGYGVQNLDTLQTVVAFFMARRGKARSFRFKDWSDYKAVLQPVGTTGSALTRQLQKTYADDENAYVRDIRLPVNGTVQVYVDTLLSVDYTVNYDTGVLTFGSDPGSDVVATFEFDLPVRFDTDDLTMSLLNFQTGSIPNIPIVELKAD